MPQYREADIKANSRFMTKCNSFRAGIQGKCFAFHQALPPKIKARHIAIPGFLFFLARARGD